MNQILRKCKFDFFLLLRCYGNQSKQCTHYETLRIPQTSSQKEIRQAFIRLSKEVHPDVKGKESHSEFVKINEAYNVLSKESLRRQYDINLKHGYSPDNMSNPVSENYSYGTTRPDSRYYYYRQTPQFTNIEEWEQYLNDNCGDNYYGIRGLKRMNTVFIAFICAFVATFVVILRLISMNKALALNKELLAKSTLYQREHKKIQEAVSSKSKEDQLKDFEAKIKQMNEAVEQLEEIS